MAQVTTLPPTTHLIIRTIMCREQFFYTVLCALSAMLRRMTRLTSSFKRTDLLACLTGSSFSIVTGYICYVFFSTLVVVLGFLVNYYSKIVWSTRWISSCTSTPTCWCLRYRTGNWKLDELFSSGAVWYFIYRNEFIWKSEFQFLECKELFYWKYSNNQKRSIRRWKKSRSAKFENAFYSQTKQPSCLEDSQMTSGIKIARSLMTDRQNSNFTFLSEKEFVLLNFGAMTTERS